MPSANKSQQRLMCMALALKRGDNSVIEGKTDAQKEAIQKAASSMSEEQLNDYCKSVES